MAGVCNCCECCRVCTTVGKKSYKQNGSGAKQAFQTVKKTLSQTGGGRCSSKLKAGESEIVDILGETASFNGIEGGFISSSSATSTRSQDDNTPVRLKDRGKRKMVVHDYEETIQIK